MRSKRQVKIKVVLFLIAYEQTEYLQECLDAITGQRCQNYTVHCFTEQDNLVACGTLKELTKNDGRFILHAVDRSDAYSEINRILRTITIPYVLFLHAGDWIRNDFLSTLLKLAEKNKAELVICNAGQRHLRSGVLRETVYTLKTNRLPVMDCFSISDVNGDGVGIVRFSSWLSLFSTDFLKKKEIFCLENGLSNDFYIGRCALACAERICAVQQQLAFLHEVSTRYLSLVHEMEHFHGFISAHPGLELAQHCFTFLFLSETAAALRSAWDDETRYSILEYLESEIFVSYGLLGLPSDAYYFRHSTLEAAFLTNALRRYRLTKQGIPHPKETAVFFRKAKKKPLVSIILPVYNTENYVERALSSVLNQTLKNIEVICYDDGSTDRSLFILEHFAQQDSRIQLFRQENCGLSVTRNRAAACARGKYLYFMDSDDFLDQKAMECAVRNAEKKQLDMLFFNAENRCEDESLTESERLQSGLIFRSQYPDMCTGPEMLALMFQSKEYTPPVWLYLLDKSFYDKNPELFISDILYEANPFTFSLLMRATRVGFLNQVMYYRTLHSDSITLGKKTFLHSYSFFKCYIDMMEVYRCAEPKLSPSQRVAAHRTVERMLLAARAFNIMLLPEEQGEEFGLGADFYAFFTHVTRYRMETDKTNTERQRADVLLKEESQCRQEAEARISELELKIHEIIEQLIELEKKRDNSM